MEHDLHLSSDQYEWLLTIFYIAYIVFEPLIIVHKVLKARVWVAILVAGWGIAATAQAAAQSWSALMACRFFLALFEAGFGPGSIYLLSFFYLRSEIGLRVAIFFSAAPLGTCFAGVLAYAITSGHASIANWRLLFLVEGLPVLVMAVVSYFAMPNSAHDAWFLTDDEKRVALARQVKQVGLTDRVGTINWRDTFLTLLDVKVWLTALMYFSCNVSYSSLPVFLPTILKDMGKYSKKKQISLENLTKFLIRSRLFRIDVSGTIRSSVFRSISRYNSHSILRGSKSPTWFVRHQLSGPRRHGISHARDRETHWCQVRGGVFCCHGRVPHHCEHHTLGAQ